MFVLNAIFFPFKNRRLNDFFIIIGIGFLPWLHQRFIPLALGLFIAFLFSAKVKRVTFKKVFVISLFLVILSLPYFYYFFSLTGNPSPLSTSKLQGTVHARWNTLPLGFFGHFFHPKFGHFWAYPWTILFFFGIYWGFKKNWKLAIALFSIFIPYYLMCSAAVPWAGPTYLLPGRFLVAIHPLFLIFCGFTIQDLSQRFSYPKLSFYLSYFVLIFLPS